MKKLICLFTFSIMLLCCSCAQTTALPSAAPTLKPNAVMFTDKGWEAEVRTLLKKQEGIITKEDLAGITRFENSAETIRSLTDLAYFSGLKELSVSYVSLSEELDLSPISALSGLNSLTLVLSVPAADLSFAKSLTGLQELSLTISGTENPANVLPIASLSGLKKLELIDMGGIDLTHLSSLGGLESLLIDACSLTDISAIGQLSSLRQLALLDNPNLKDIAPLAKLNNLTRLDLQASPIESLEPLRGLAKLEELYAPLTTPGLDWSAVDHVATVVKE